MKTRYLLALAAAGIIAASPVAITAQAPAPQVNVAKLAKGLKPQHGKIALPAAKASLDLGTDYDFYGPADAKTILVDIWGNPPENAEGVLGLVMQAGKSPIEDNWGAIVTYEASGYVPDTDAAMPIRIGLRNPKKNLPKIASRPSFLAISTPAPAATNPPTPYSACLSISGLKSA